MARGTIRALSIHGLRTIADLDLRLDGLTVLVGDNGSGKSSILEALELCRRIGHGDFLGSLHSLHGGLGSLLRRGSRLLQLAIEVDLGDVVPQPGAARYVLELGNDRENRTTVAERLELRLAGAVETPFLFLRADSEAKLWNGSELAPLTRPRGAKHSRNELLLTELSGPLAPHPAINAVQEALAAIEVHLPFEVTPTWAARAHQRSSAARGSAPRRRAAAAQAATARA